MVNQVYICENCGKEHDGSYGSGRFCCKACANTRHHSEETKKKISSSVKNYIISLPKETKEKISKSFLGREMSKETREKISKGLRKFYKSEYILELPYVKCSYCGKEIDLRMKKINKNNRYYCNGTCRNIDLNKKKIIGGINSGISISNWEKILQQCLIENGIEFVANCRDILSNGLELDIWLPFYKIGIELNGIFHYSPKPYNNNMELLLKRIEKDKRKIDEMKKLNYVLIVIEDRNVNCDYKLFFDKLITDIKNNNLDNWIINA